MTATASEDAQPDRSPGAAESGADESTTTVLVALAANVGIGVLKLAAGLITGSAALLSEAAHSVGDASTELLLLTALRRSDRPADRIHPFGYGKERYFWSLLAAVTILVSGAAFSIYQGVHTIVSGHESSRLIWINYPVLAIGLVLEGASFRQATKQATRAARRGRRSVRSYLRDPDDPTVKSVFLEDSAALIGLVIAALGVGLHQLTGSSVWDGGASLCIGLLLVVAAFLLAQTCKSLLIGKQADPRFLRTLSSWLETQPEVTDVVDVLTMMVGTDQVLLCARVDFVDSYTAAELEKACARMDIELSEQFPLLSEIFIQPVPRSDPAMRDRVLRRYGRVLADEPEDGSRTRTSASPKGDVPS
ncbi:MAG: cation diffusion facilitator family transporter [Frankiales bacterium]|nr:cation diffusion facilitator family transporter [Frankiales bacterium]